MNLKAISRLKVVILSSLAGALGVLFFWLFIRFTNQTGEGTDRPDWLPEEATDVSYRVFGKVFGWIRFAELKITEDVLKAYATQRGWTFLEKRGVTKVDLLLTVGRSEEERAVDDYLPLPRVLVYERRASNGGGITLMFDPTTSRAYYSESDR